MKINASGVVNHIDISKELEIINFRLLHENLKKDDAKEGDIKHWILEGRNPEDKSKARAKDQVISFQKAMQVLLIWGQCLGLNPVTGILQKDVSKMSFNVCSWKFLYAMVMALSQSIALSLSIHKLFRSPVSISALGYVSFYSGTFYTTLSFIRISTKWPSLLKELSNSRLDEYIDPKIIRKCKIACIAFLGMGAKHTLSLVATATRVIDCGYNVTNFGQELLKKEFPWLNEFNIPYSTALWILLQYFILNATAIWNYPDMFVVCISLYLTSILQQIIKKITLAADKNYMPTSIWGVLREDYTRATRLIRLFDDVISSVVLVAFAIDLFFICLQMYNILSNGLRISQIMARACPSNLHGPSRGYTYPAYLSYLTYSTLFLFTRFLTVALVAAGVNTASLEPAHIMYRIPSSAYTKEVRRFLNQINNDVVALSGMQFFYVTRELVLSVAGTIVTYELVLLQFSSDDLNKTQ